MLDQTITASRSTNIHIYESVRKKITIKTHATSKDCGVEMDRETVAELIAALQAAYDRPVHTRESICTVPNCGEQIGDRGLVSLGLCGTHYSEHYRNKRKATYGPCISPGCTNTAHARTGKYAGLCSTHARWIKQMTTEGKK